MADPLRTASVLMKLTQTVGFDEKNTWKQIFETCQSLGIPPIDLYFGLIGQLPLKMHRFERDSQRLWGWMEDLDEQFLKLRTAVL